MLNLFPPEGLALAVPFPWSALPPDLQMPGSFISFPALLKYHALRSLIWTTWRQVAHHLLVFSTKHLIPSKMTMFIYCFVSQELSVFFTDASPSLWGVPGHSNCWSSKSVCHSFFMGKAQRGLAKDLTSQVFKALFFYCRICIYI